MKRRGLSPLILLYILVLGEAGVRLRAALYDRAPANPDRFLKREWQWALDHLAAGIATFSSYAEYDPELGWRMKANLVDPKWRTNSGGPVFRKKTGWHLSIECNRLRNCLIEACLTRTSPTQAPK